MFVLSRVAERGHIRRRSFGRWLIPRMLRDVLRLDRIATFTFRDLEKMLEETDPIIVAWGQDARPNLDD